MPASPADLTTADVVAADLGVTADATVQRVVTAASRAIASFCGRSFEKATVTEYPTSVGRPFLLVSRPPILTIASITEGGALIDPSEYEAVSQNAAAGVIYRLRGVWMPTLRDFGRITPDFLTPQGRSDSQGITVIYDGGWVTPGQGGAVTLPEDVQEAAIMTAVQFYRRRGQDLNIASESLGDWAVVYQGVNTAIGRGGPIPEAAQALLAPYLLVRAA